MTTAQPPLAAEISPVREVTLTGSADLDRWSALLAPEGLSPADIGSKARLILTASDSVFKGFPFREFALSVEVVPPRDDLGASGHFLAHAFNSSRFFAFIERAVFHTPYYHAQVSVDTRIPASVTVSRDGAVCFRAEMGSGASRLPRQDAPDRMHGPIYLPRGAMRTGGKLFYATLEGQTQTYAFDPGTDVVTVSPSATDAALIALRDSGFQAEDWIIREHARHAKSRTIRWAPAARS